jgi:hypothetical protein
VAETTRTTAPVDVIAVSDWGSVAEWVSGIGALTAALAAVGVALFAQRNADQSARAARRAAARDRTVDLLVRLVAAVEEDIALVEARGLVDFQRSASGQSLCRALWGHRNLFGATWHAYCEDDRGWIVDLMQRGELFDRMRSELQSALDQLDAEDRNA